MNGFPEAAEILDARPARREDGDEIGISRQGRSIRAFRFGEGNQRVSLIGGCHADEPVGPLFLRHLAGFLDTVPGNHPIHQRFHWWIVPHANPDGEAVNRSWYSDDDEAYDLGRYLSQAVREKPGDDIEFGFPRGEDDDGARPENQAIWQWWRTSANHFALHATLHGMAFAAGPWYLVEQAWQDRISPLMQACREDVAEMGYRLHDVEREGEKGFVRLAPGFTTRPDSRAMRRYFTELGDDETAQLFRPSSMETVRSLGGDPLTLVSEMPLFITPGVGEDLGPPDPAAVEWRERIAKWRSALEQGAASDEVSREAESTGLRPMPVRHQMQLQWGMIKAGLELVG